MSNTIQIKRSATTATPSALAVGELAYSEASGNFFIGVTGNGVTKIGGYTDVSKLAGIEAGAQVNTVTSVAGYTGAVTLAKGDVGLGNVDNTSDANKPVSTATQTALNLKANIASPTFTGTVSGITAAMVGAPSGSGTSTGTNTGDQDLSGLVTKITTVNGHALSSNVTITASDVGLGNVTNESKATMFSSPTFTGTVSGVTATMVGLGNVTNESKATMFSSPTFTGTVTVPTPLADTSAATKGYVDSVATGLNIKAAVKTATTSNGTFATAFANGSTVGGVVVSTGDRILIKDQTSGAENGIYVVQATGAPVRSTDADNSPVGEVTTGMMTFVQTGTLAGTQWALTTTGTITIDSTALTFVQFGGSIVYTAGTGLTLSGTSFAIDGTVLTTSSTLDVTKFSSGTASAFNGSAITNLNGSNISSGTVADARLSSNVLFNSSTIDGGTF